MIDPKLFTSQIDDIKAGVAKASSKRALNQLAERLSALLNEHCPDESWAQAAILLASEMQELQSREMMGLMTTGEDRVARNKWVYNFLNLLAQARQWTPSSELPEPVEVETEVGEQDVAPKRAEGALRVFLSYHESDAALKQQLDSHLIALKRGQLIEVWSDEEIKLGQDMSEATRKQLQRADVVLLLVSASFIACDEIWKTEVEQAMARREQGTIVVPISLRPCDWEGLPFAKLQGLPRSGQPITSYPDLDLAFMEVARELRALVK
jgi:hypothetical protein